MKAMSPTGSIAMPWRRRTHDRGGRACAPLVMSALLCAFGAGSDRAASQPAAAERPQASDPAGEKRDHDAAVANCVSMWDGATHMTKQQWLRACRRVQERLRTLSVH
jgi:hypothetical protein